MSPRTPHIVLQAAIAQGLLPDTARFPPTDDRPWPVVLLTALGAWLAVVPLLVVVGLLFGNFLQGNAAYYLVGGLLLAAAVVLLRSRGLPLFVEHLALPALLVGGGALGAGVMRDLQVQAGAAAMAALAGGLAAWLPRHWLRSLLGAGAAVLLALACLPSPWDRWHILPLWLGWHVALALWLLAMWAQQHGLTRPAWVRWACGLEPFAAGWLLATLVGLAGWAGLSFLVGASLGGGLVGEVARHSGERGATPASWPSALSALLAGAAAAWVIHHAPGLRRPWHMGLALVLCALAWFMPTLGAVCLALAHCFSSARRRLAAAAAAAGLWILGAFYYQLQWPLAHKAILLMLAGALLAALAWWARRSDAVQDSDTTGMEVSAAGTGSRAAILATVVLVLVVANLGIWQKESLIASGQPVFVALAPVDPRSLVQGDFMQLSFAVPAFGKAIGLRRAQRPRVVMRRDARGVATSVRVDDGTPQDADELRIELTPKIGRWILVTDAWFFAEGEAVRWAAARFGEFRVDAQGRALLVMLRGADLQPL